MSGKFHRVYNWAGRRKYLIAFCIFIPWILFFDKFSVVGMLQQRAKMEKLEKTKTELLNEKLLIESKYDGLIGNSTEIEKFARENFFFKKDNEDIFIVQDSSNKETLQP